MTFQSPIFGADAQSRAHPQVGGYGPRFNPLFSGLTLKAATAAKAVEKVEVSIPYFRG